MTEDYEQYTTPEGYCGFVCENLVGCEEQCLAVNEDCDEEYCREPAYYFLDAKGIDYDTLESMDDQSGRLADVYLKEKYPDGKYDAMAWNYGHYRNRAILHRNWLRDHWEDGLISDTEAEYIVSVTWSIRMTAPALPPRLARLLKGGR